MDFSDWPGWQLDVAATLYPDNPDLELELIKRRTEANKREQQALATRAKELRHGR